MLKGQPSEKPFGQAHIGPVLNRKSSVFVPLLSQTTRTSQTTQSPTLMEVLCSVQASTLPSPLQCALIPAVPIWCHQDAAPSIPNTSRNGRPQSQAHHSSPSGTQALQWRKVICTTNTATERQDFCVSQRHSSSEPVKVDHWGT